MVIYTKTYDLLSWLLPKSEAFPKQYRHTLTDRLLGSLFDFTEAIYAARVYRDSTRLRYLRVADSSLSKLRLYLRLTHKFQWINDGQYHHVSVMVDEVGRFARWLDCNDVKISKKCLILILQISNL